MPVCRNYVKHRLASPLWAPTRRAFLRLRPPGVRADSHHQGNRARGASSRPEPLGSACRMSTEQLLFGDDTSVKEGVGPENRKTMLTDGTARYRPVAELPGSAGAIAPTHLSSYDEIGEDLPRCAGSKWPRKMSLCPTGLRLCVARRSHDVLSPEGVVR